jgi:hypothetical protein
VLVDAMPADGTFEYFKSIDARAVDGRDEHHDEDRHVAPMVPTTFARRAAKNRS